MCVYARRLWAWHRGGGRGSGGKGAAAAASPTPCSDAGSVDEGNVCFVSARALRGARERVNNVKWLRWRNGHTCYPRAHNSLYSSLVRTHAHERRRTDSPPPARDCNCRPSVGTLTERFHTYNILYVCVLRERGGRTNHHSIIITAYCTRRENRHHNTINIIIYYDNYYTVSWPTYIITNNMHPFFRYTIRKSRTFLD